jgi:hypothetical protein
MFARTGAPKPIEESWRLFFKKRKIEVEHTLYEDRWKTKNSRFQIVTVPLGYSFLQINKCTTTYKKNILGIYLHEGNQRVSTCLQ